MAAEYPDDFREVRVTLTRKEYDQLRYEAILTGEGSVRAALRIRAGMPEKPYGIEGAIARMRRRHADDEEHEAERGDDA